MTKKTNTMRWTILTLAAVVCLSSAAWSEAQEQEAQKSAAEIQAEIDQLQAQLKKAQETERQKTENNAKPLKATDVSPGRIATAVVGKYVGTEGDDRIGIEIGPANKEGVYPILIYEAGLPGKGYDPKDDDKYVGTATLNSVDTATLGPSSRPNWSPIWLNVALTQKFDGTREEPVESTLRELRFFVHLTKTQDGLNIILTTERNREWGAIRVSQDAAKDKPIKPVDKGGVYAQFAGRYLGWEGDDRLGMELTSQVASDSLTVVIYEGGLPGAGYRADDDDRYEGTFDPATGEILLTKKFDEGREERVENALKKIVPTFVADTKGNLMIRFPSNNEWNAVELTKEQ